MELNSDQNSRSGRTFWFKMFLLAVLLLTGALLFFKFRHQLQLEYLAERETALREFQESYWIGTLLIAALVYVVVAGFSLPGGATLLSVVYAWYFGFFTALILVSFSSTTGATIAFLLSRYFFRESFSNRFGKRLSAFNENLKQDGAFYLFTLRLIPAVPFFLINIVMGLTPIRTSTFWWVSQIGMLPGTAVYVFFGASFPDLKTLSERGLSGVLKWELMLAFILLATVPLIIKKIYTWFRPVSESGDIVSEGAES